MEGDRLLGERIELDNGMEVEVIEKWDDGSTDPEHYLAIGDAGEFMIICEGVYGKAICPYLNYNVFRGPLDVRS